MACSLFGMEVEVAVSGISPDGHPVPNETIVSGLMNQARRRLPCLPARGRGGIFLQNGILLYVDTGYHPECCTPECSDPAEVVRFLKAAEKILLGLGQNVALDNPEVSEVMFYRTNVSYGNGATWGCHESYFHTSEPQQLPRQLLPHFASRIIFTGAGGFHPCSQGVEFTLSPRVHFLTGSISGSSTESRGVYHTKNESLSRQGNRLHVLCGEANSSDLSTYLKIGTTALILAAIDRGVRVGEGVGLTDALGAMRTFAADPTCRATVPLEDGRWLRAIDIQRHYLAKIEYCVDEPWMPAWAEDVCIRWREVLDLLESGPQGVAGRIDWAAKHALYEGWLQTVNYDWKRIEVWNSVQTRLRVASIAKGYRRMSLNRHTVLGPDSILNTEVQKLTPLLFEAGISWDEFEKVRNLRDRMMEIDTRFGQYGPKGIFNAMDAEGLLSHRVAGCEEFPDPIAAIPSAGRAQLRSVAIRKLHPNNIRYRCDWMGVYDWSGAALVDLANPFVSDPAALRSLDELDDNLNWQPAPERRPHPRGLEWQDGLPMPDELVQFRLRLRRRLPSLRAAEDLRARPFRIGDTVRLLVPKPCPNREGQDVKPEEYTEELPGRKGWIAGYCDLDHGGCLAVPVAIDNRFYRWRIRDLEKIPELVTTLCG